jgi:hypothetical protein
MRESKRPRFRALSVEEFSRLAPEERLVYLKAAIIEARLSDANDRPPVRPASQHHANRSH